MMRLITILAGLTSATTAHAGLPDCNVYHIKVWSTLLVLAQLQQAVHISLAIIPARLLLSLLLSLSPS